MVDRSVGEGATIPKDNLAFGRTNGYVIRFHEGSSHQDIYVQILLNKTFKLKRMTTTVEAQASFSQDFQRRGAIRLMSWLRIVSNLCTAESLIMLPVEPLSMMTLAWWWPKNVSVYGDWRTRTLLDASNVSESLCSTRSWWRGGSTLLDKRSNSSLSLSRI